MRVPVLQNINWDPSAPAGMQTNSAHTGRHIYTATWAGKVTHTDIFRHSYTHEDTRRSDRRAETDVPALTTETEPHLGLQLGMWMFPTRAPLYTPNTLQMLHQCVVHV